MNFIQIEDNHLRNMDAYQIDYRVYKGIGRPLKTDYTVKQLIKQRRLKVKKASVKSTGIDYKTPALLVIYLILMLLFAPSKGL